MSRVLAIDYGIKRTGLAVSDSQKIIANELETIESKLLINFIEGNVMTLQLSTIVLGNPRDLYYRKTDLSDEVERIFKEIRKRFPTLEVKLIDERFTSKIARDTLYMMGLSKKKRREKERIDKISALILLQNFLDFNTYL